MKWEAVAGYGGKGTGSSGSVTGMEKKSTGRERSVAGYGGKDADSEGGVADAKEMSLVEAGRSLTGMKRSLVDARKKIGRMTFIGLIFKLILYTQ